MNAEMVEMSAALDEWARIYERMYDAESFHASLTYIEAEALADLLAVTGRVDLGRNLLETWAEYDPEEAEEHAEDLMKWATAHPKCNECDQTATQHWPNINPPVQLCENCYHDAYRSGWEPGK